jgi:hypothetical protein
MGKAIVSVILGYVVMAVTVFITFTVAYLVLGADGAFKPETYDITTTWVVISIVLSFVAAIAGGIVCAAVAKSPKPPKVLAAFVLILGLLLTIPSLTRDEVQPEVRMGETGNIEAMQGARQPLWITLLNPFIGAVGILVGAGLVMRNRGQATDD